SRAPRLFLAVLNPTPPAAIYTLSLHDALPIFLEFCLEGLDHRLRPRNKIDRVVEFFACRPQSCLIDQVAADEMCDMEAGVFTSRSEEHTSELQSRENLVCRLLLEKKKQRTFSF